MITVIRRPYKGFVHLDNHQYFSIDLIDYDQDVFVERVVDSEVKVMDMRGAFICRALLNTKRVAKVGA